MAQSERTGNRRGCNRRVPNPGQPQVAVQITSDPTTEHGSQPPLHEITCIVHSEHDEMDRIEQTIQQARQAIADIPENSQDRALYLFRLAKQLNRKHSTTSSIAYLDEGIRIIQLAVDVVPEEYLNRGRIIHNLSSQLHDRYVRNKSMTDLNKAILIARDSIDALQEDDPALPLFFGNLGNLLMDRYYGKGVKWDLDEAIDCTRQALNAVTNDDQARASLLDRLGISLGHYHWRGGIGSDPALKGYLEEAITVSRQAVELTPKDHPALAGRLKNLGTHLGHKYHSTKAKDQDELRECIKCHVAAVHAEQSPTLRRIQSSSIGRIAMFRMLSRQFKPLDMNAKDLMVSFKHIPRHDIVLETMRTQRTGSYLRRERVPLTQHPTTKQLQ